MQERKSTCITAAYALSCTCFGIDSTAIDYANHVVLGSGSLKRVYTQALPNAARCIKQQKAGLSRICALLSLTAEVTFISTADGLTQYLLANANFMRAHDICYVCDML